MQLSKFLKSFIILGKYFIILGTQSLKGTGIFLFSLFMDYYTTYVQLNVFMYSGHALINEIWLIFAHEANCNKPRLDWTVLLFINVW